MLHSRKFTFSARGISRAEIIRNDQTQHRIAQKLQRFVMKLPSLVLRPWRHLFVRPGAVRDGALQQGTVLKLVSENVFQGVEIRKFYSLFLQS